MTKCYLPGCEYQRMSRKRPFCAQHWEQIPLNIMAGIRRNVDDETKKKSYMARAVQLLIARKKE